jgi:hypothetical protein
MLVVAVPVVVVTFVSGEIVGTGTTICMRGPRLPARYLVSRERHRRCAGTCARMIARSSRNT